MGKKGSSRRRRTPRRLNLPRSSATSPTLTQAPGRRHQQDRPFLDPVIAVLAPKGGFWTPNGRHRLAAMGRLGAKSIAALVVADQEVAWQILALNTEKAHNLKERSLEVIRIYRGLVEEDAARPESSFAFYLDEASLVTLGICYERAPRFGGGAYHVSVANYYFARQFLAFGFPARMPRCAILSSFSSMSLLFLPDSWVRAASVLWSSSPFFLGNNS